MGKKKITYQPNNLAGYFHRLKGAVVSGNVVAIKAILFKLLVPLSRLLDFFLSLFINKQDLKETDKIKALVIVSSPRAGATLIYQAFIRMIPSIYISNLHALLPGTASAIMKKLQLFGHLNLKNYKNYYGYTSKLNDVNEGNFLIDPIFRGNPSDAQIRKRFLNLLNKLGVNDKTPLIIKNARNYNNILKLSKAVPEITFIRIRRNPEQIIQSELRAFYELGTFHPIPDELEHHKDASPVEFAVKQIIAIEKQLDDQLSQMNKEQVLELNYEAFCENPREKIQMIASSILNMHEDALNKKLVPQQFSASRRKKVDDQDKKRIKELLHKNL